MILRTGHPYLHHPPRWKGQPQRYTRSISDVGIHYMQTTKSHVAHLHMRTKWNRLETVQKVREVMAHTIPDIRRIFCHFDQQRLEVLCEVDVLSW